MNRRSAYLIFLGGIALSSLPAQGAETIIFEYQDTEVKVSRQDFETLAKTGNFPPDVQNVLGSDFNAPPLFQQFLSRPIRLPKSVGQFLDSSTGEFLLERLNGLIRNTSGQKAENLTFLKSALTQAVQDQQVFFLDLVRQYPQDQVRVNITGLEQTYGQVVDFVEKIPSESNGIKQFFADLLCDCKRTASEATYRSTSGLFAQTTVSDCFTVLGKDARESQMPISSLLTQGHRHQTSPRMTHE